jgi:2-polyprenyl-3-methyl-5-hydroxy-6-metoxy-1,4-benzoquinol methylase
MSILKATLFKKDESYYSREKSRIASLVPEGPNVILDVGCAAGHLGRKLRELNKVDELVGVEIFQPAAAEAEKHYDAVHQGDVEVLSLPYQEYFDFVICGDILEHLRDPWAMLSRIYGWLKEDGTLICSIPNVRYWRILRDLIIFRKWEYIEAGILDNTHLRFFTRSSFTKILKSRDFRIIHNEMIIDGKKQNLCNRLTFGLFEEFLGSQVMVLAKKRIQ